tara:strand:- start:102 stop:563 length:462 start_codon:yes stop_codon:yes gene_type:complete
MKRAIIIFLSLFSSSLFALDLTYDTPLDPYYCDSNPVECRPLPNRIPPFKITPKATNTQWITFFTFQVLDVYSTSKALKYDCIKEINPLYTERPSDARLVATKTILLAPALLYNDEYKKMDADVLNSTNMLYMFVVANNFRLLNNAKDTCNKR